MYSFSITQSLTGCSVGAPIAGCVLNISGAVSFVFIKVLDVLGAVASVMSLSVVGVGVDSGASLVLAAEVDVEV